jgi:hypothetical protein
MKKPSGRAALLFVCFGLGASACGGDPPPPPEPPPAPAPPPAPPPEPAASASAAPSAAPAAEPPKRVSSGRPPVIFSDDAQVTQTFGTSPGAKIEIGGANGAIFRVPENALSQGVNITFKVDTKGKANGPPIGKIYHIIPLIPPATTSTTVQTADAPFEIQIHAGKKKDANLAVGVISTDDKGREKITWTVLAAKRFDDSTGFAQFEVPTLGDSFVHLTAKPPSGGEK